MVKDTYIGIENELRSFQKEKNENDTELGHNGFHIHEFNTDDFTNFFKDRYFNKAGFSVISSHGNEYYVRRNGIKIITPSIALNKGFSTRLTNALVLGRNYVIENTPHLLHTGYSIDWTLSHDSTNFNSYGNRELLIDQLAVPFGLFGLTPLSRGFVQQNDAYNRHRIMGDSVTNVDQINATALLLGAYTLAIEKNPGVLHLDVASGGFPIKILSYIRPDGYVKVLNNRYSVLRCSIRTDPKTDAIFSYVQAQNVLELFYDWISPFVYKLGEHDEINNLEAFIKGEKKLEMDDVKYFDILKNNNGIDEEVYFPLEVLTSKGLRSQILTVTNKDTLNVPIEGELLGIYALNSMPNKISILEKNKFLTKSMGVDYVSLIPIKNGEYFEDSEELSSIEEIYDFAQKYTPNTYSSSLDVSGVKTNILSGTDKMKKIHNSGYYDPNNDNSI